MSMDIFMRVILLVVTSGLSDLKNLWFAENSHSDLTWDQRNIFILDLSIDSHAGGKSGSEGTIWVLSGPVRMVTGESRQEGPVWVALLTGLCLAEGGRERANLASPCTTRSLPQWTSHSFFFSGVCVGVSILIIIKLTVYIKTNDPL